MPTPGAALTEYLRASRTNRRGSEAVDFRLEPRDSLIRRDDARGDDVDLRFQALGYHLEVPKRFRRRALDEFLELFIHRVDVTSRPEEALMTGDSRCILLE